MSHMLELLMAGASVNMPAEVRESTGWVPEGTRTISMPSDINDCACAETAKILGHISLGRHGLEMPIAAPKSVFGEPMEVIAALSQ